MPLKLVDKSIRASENSGETVSLVDYAWTQQQEYHGITTPEGRKKIGHFGTPPVIARFMATMLNQIPVGKVRLADAGAGVGILAAAVCERICQLKVPRHLEVDLYETDKALIPFLKRTMDVCQSALAAHGHSMTYKILSEDFILSLAPISDELFPTSGKTTLPEYDAVIMNPPYFKIAKDSIHAKRMGYIVHGQPNIYALFMAIAADRLSEKGEIVAITPRSYFNGPYFKSFRQSLLKRIAPFWIHIFESRTDSFQEEKVLQENVIFVGKRNYLKQSVKISSSMGRDLHALTEIDVSRSMLIDESRGDSIIRVASNQHDVQILNFIDSFGYRLNDHGFAISTGPVVTFRSAEYLLTARQSDGSSSPLITMRNVRPFTTIFPPVKDGSSVHFKVCPETQKLLLSSKRYVLLKRFTSKEERRRLVAGVFEAKHSYSEYVGLENHLNYVHRPQGELSIEEAYGLASIFNSVLYDRYFRCVSGNTQVNANEIRGLPLPSMDVLTSIGKVVNKLIAPSPTAVEEIVIKHLEVNGEIASYLMDLSIGET